MARSSKSVKLSAIVLGTRRFREQDRIVLFLARDFGRLDAAAYGASKPGSRFAGLLEPFSHLRILAVGGSESDLWTIREAEAIEISPVLDDRFRLHALQTAAELIVHAGPHEAMERETWPLVEVFRREIVAARDPLGPLCAFAVAWSIRAGYGRPEAASAAATRFIRVAAEAEPASWRRFRITLATRRPLVEAIRRHIEQCTEKKWVGMRAFFEAPPLRESA